MADDVSANPFDALDDPNAPKLAPGARPTLSERFSANMKAGNYHNTIAGVVATEGDMPARKRFDRYYESLPDWEGFSEAGAALAGQFAGTMLTPESLIGGVGGAAAVAKMGISGIRGRILAGAIDAAAVNAVTDAGIQGYEVGRGLRDEFSATQLAGSVAIGAAIGGGVGGVGGAIAARRASGAAAEMPPAGDANPFDALDTVEGEAPGQGGDAAPVEAEAAAPSPSGASETARPAAEAAAPAPIAPDQAVTIRDPAIGDLPAGELDGLSVTVAQDQSGVPETMLAVDLPDGRRAVVGKGLIDDTAAPESSAPESAASDSSAPPSQVNEGAPKVDQPDTVPQSSSPDVVSEPAAIGDSLADDVGVGRARLNEKPPETLKSQGVSREELAPPRRSDDGVKADPEVVEAPVMTRLSEVSGHLEELLDVPAVRQGRLKGGAIVQGQFGLKTGVVRVRRVNDFDTFTHEAGHHFEMKFPAFQALVKKHAAELEPLAYAGADPKVLDREGFAEFFRLWMTNRLAAENAAPGFAKAFAAALADLDPSISKGLDEIAGAYRDYLAQPSGQAVTSSVISGRRAGWAEKTAESLKKYGLGQTIADRFNDLYATFIDNLHPLYTAVRGLQDIHFRNTGKVLDLKVDRDAYKLARMSRGAHSVGHMDILYGVHDYRGIEPGSASLRDALIEAMGSPNMFSRWDDGRAQDFGAYLWSRRAIGEYARFERGEIPNPPDKLTKGDHSVNITEMESRYPAFVDAAAKIYDWNRALWKKKMDAGLITPEQYTEGLKIVDYVPGLRDFSSERAGQPDRAGSRDQSAKSGFVKRFQGSRRDVINPIDSMITDAYETASAIARNDVIRQLDRLALMAGNGPGGGGGAIAERIPAKELRATLVDPLEAITIAAKNSGLSGPDIIVLRDAVEGAIGDEKAAIFRPAIINEKGEAIAFFRDGGRLQALKLADGKFGRDLYAALTQMGAPEKNWFVTMLAKPAALLRAGITTSLDFIGANIARDYMQSVILYGRPIERARRIAGGMAEEVMGADIARRYNIGMGMSGGQNVSSLRDSAFNKDMKALKDKGWAVQRLTSLKGVLEIAELSETATRLGLFKTFVDEAKARGLDDFEATMEGSYRARDYMDFDRRGWGLAHLARVIPFLNASVQGLDKASRHMVVPFVKKMRGDALTPAEERDLGMAAKSWAYLAMGTAASVSLYAWMSRHEDYDEISATTRATHWMIKAGDKWIAVPKPFEFALAFNLAEATFDSVTQGDALAYDRYMSGAMQMLMPPSILEGNPAITSYFEVKANKDLFTGRDIIPEETLGMEPWLQYSEYTSVFSRQLGKELNQPPALIDHLLTGHFGSWGRNLLSLYDHYSDMKPEQGWDEAFVTRRFIKDASRGSNSSNRFWELMARTSGRLKGVASSFDALMGLGDEADEDAADGLPLTAEAADFVGSLNEREYAYLNSLLVPGAIPKKQRANYKRRHPLRRAEDVLGVLRNVRRDIAFDRFRDVDGKPASKQMRGAALDILSDLSMAEVRNALILTGEPGWSNKKEIPTDTYLRELDALSPALTQALLNGYMKEKIAPYNTIKQEWPAVRKALAGDLGNVDLRPFIKQIEDYGGDFRDAGITD